MVKSWKHFVYDQEKEKDVYSWYFQHSFVCSSHSHTEKKKKLKKSKLENKKQNRLYL